MKHVSHLLTQSWFVGELIFRFLFPIINRCYHAHGNYANMLLIIKGHIITEDNQCWIFYSFILPSLQKETTGQGWFAKYNSNTALSATAQLFFSVSCMKPELIVYSNVVSHILSAWVNLCRAQYFQIFLIRAVQCVVVRKLIFNGTVSFFLDWVQLHLFSQLE